MSGGPHLAHWPPRAPLYLDLPGTSVYDNLAVTARRFPDKTALIYYGTPLSYAALHRQVLALAGYLTQVLGVGRRDRVLLLLQNAPQFVVAYYAVLCAEAVAVPVTPMSQSDELRHLLSDAEPTAAILGQELWPVLAPVLAQSTLRGTVVATYGDCLANRSFCPLPAIVEQPRALPQDPMAVGWRQALAAGFRPQPHRAAAEDWAVLVYSSGTTGRPKGCLHTHRSVQATLWISQAWNPTWSSSVVLATLPLFHVTGMQMSMNVPIAVGATTVLMTRWDRRLAAQLIERHGVTHWRSITAMAVDLLADPELQASELASLRAIGGGGAPIPKAIIERLRVLTGLGYVEGYGLSETMAGTHVNPPQRIKPGTIGIPVLNVDSRIVDPETLAELPQGEVGEIVTASPQLFLGYWRNPEATAAAVFERDGKRFLRTGDLGFVDEEGYFVLVDRLKRMVNAAGFKVWPAEVEALLYEHPAVLEACVIAAPDERRGETVKAVIVPRAGARLTLPELQDWCRERMAAYKVPRLLALVDSLPKSGAGKILWRNLQEAEWSRS